MAPSALMAGCAARAGAPGPCVPAGEAASFVPLWTDGASLLVDVGLNRHDEKLVLDTGASWTTLTETAARAVDADPIGVVQVMHGDRTVVMAGLARVSQFSFAGGKMGDALVDVAEARPWLHDTFKGSLGNDFLQNWDVDLDLPDGVLVLEHPQTCSPARASWPGQDVRVAVGGDDGEVAFPVSVDGVRRSAILDTGATVTTLAGGGRAGGRAPRNTGVEYGYEAVFRARPIRIDHLEIGGHDFGGLSAVRADGWDGPEVVLGLDFLSRHRVLISYGTKSLFIDPD